MTVAFRVDDDVARFGPIAFLRSEPGPVTTTLSILRVNVQSEALEFRSATRMTLGLAAEPRRALVHDAVESLLDHHPRDGLVLLRDGDLAESALGMEDRTVAVIRTESKLADTGGTKVRWLRKRLPEDSWQRQAVSRMAKRGLLLEPFERLKRIVTLSAERVTIQEMAPPLGSWFRKEGVVDWPHEFMPFQQEGISALVQRSTLLLADDMGLGKTVQASAALRILLRTGEIENALIVTPAAVLRQWYRALLEWAPDLRVSAIHGANRAWRWNVPAHLYLTTYETLRSDFTTNPQSPPRRRTWGAVVLDEAQKVKNRDIDLAHVCKQLPRIRSWALTGTPLENRLDDLRSICEFLLPGAQVGELNNTDRLKQAHSRLQLRRRKSDVLTQLPPKRYIDVALDLGRRQRASYDRAELEGVIWLRNLGETATITHVLELITRLKQICNFCPESSESAKVEDLRERLAELQAQDHRALVFSQYVDDRFGARAIRNQIENFEPLLYTGDLDPAERESILRRFRETASPLLISLRAGGQGLNLQEASYVFHFDRWWNPAVERQAEDRSHRFGQTETVTVYTYTCRNTIEERIAEVIRSKIALFNEWVDDVTIDVTRRLTEKELFKLFGLEPPRQVGMPAEGRA